MYKGERKDDMRHGEGVSYYGNGEIYIGREVDHFKQGEGEFVFKDGGRYRGEWHRR